MQLIYVTRGGLEGRIWGFFLPWVFPFENNSHRRIMWASCTGEVTLAPHPYAVWSGISWVCLLRVWIIEVFLVSTCSQDSATRGHHFHYKAQISSRMLVMSISVGTTLHRPRLFPPSTIDFNIFVLFHVNSPLVHQRSTNEDYFWTGEEDLSEEGRVGCVAQLCIWPGHEWCSVVLKPLSSAICEESTIVLPQFK